MKNVIALILMMCAAALGEVTARGTFDAAKDVAFNSAIQAIDANWHLRNSNFTRGSLWFITDANLKDASFDAGVLISAKDSGSELHLVLRPLKKEPKQSDADQLLAQLLKSMRGKKAQGYVGPVIVNRDGGREMVLPEISIERGYSVAAKVARAQGHLVREDPATHELVFISNTGAEDISLGLTLADEFGDLRIAAKHWRPNGSNVSNETYAQQVFGNFIEGMQNELKGDRSNGN